MFASIRKLTTALGAVAVLAVATPSFALPVFAQGSFSMATFLSGPFTDVDLTTTFNLATPVFTGSPVQDFVAVPPPAVLMSPASFDFVTGAGFAFADAAFGSFAVSSVQDIGDAQNGFHQFNVLGTFTPGTSWANSGANISANMRWSLTQAGDPDDSTSISGTFHSPAQAIPEPASALLLGIGLAGAGLSLRRRQRARA